MILATFCVEYFRVAFLGTIYNIGKASLEKNLSVRIIFQLAVLKKSTLSYKLVPSYISEAK